VTDSDVCSRGSIYLDKISSSAKWILKGLGLRRRVSIDLTVVAAAYAAVGQGGATGYIAVLGLVGLGPDIIRPAALTLNVLVSAIGTAQFARVGLINWRSFCPFALLGVPCSILGGIVHLPAFIYHPVIGALLVLAAWQMVRSVGRTDGDDDQALKQCRFFSKAAR
jgi:uncharacterized membrane protein YfcA